MKQAVWIGQVLTSARRGIYTQDIWYDDGTHETREVPMGAFPFPKELFLEPMGEGPTTEDPKSNQTDR